MGPSINNLNTLLRMPFGCGEQNMLLFVPNIVVTEYLKVRLLYLNYARVIQTDCQFTFLEYGSVN